MIKLDSLLFSVFERLRHQGVPIGVSEYITVIEAIQTKAGLNNTDSIKELCRLLWTKSREDQELFDQNFEELIESQLQINSMAELASLHEKSPPSTPTLQSLTMSSDASLLQSEIEEEGKTSSQMEEIILPARSVSKPSILSTELINEPQHYQLTPRLPIGRRDMAGVWRQMRRPQRAGIPEELDVEGTINMICRTGFFLRPVLQPRRRNQTNLIVLLDQQGSMAPFSILIEATIDGILRGGLLGNTNLYYFNNCPEEYLYYNSSLINSVPLEKVLQEGERSNSVLVVSDAGAARGYYDKSRIIKTKVFLQKLRTHTHLYAWLNPMPQNRWFATTAEEIAYIVPMFPLDREGLNDTVSALRGHQFLNEVDIDG